jgi:hypothetical protein
VVQLFDDFNDNEDPERRHDAYGNAAPEMIGRPCRICARNCGVPALMSCRTVGERFAANGLAQADREVFVPE